MLKIRRVPIIMTSGNHEAYQVPYGISARVEAGDQHNWAFMLGVLETTTPNSRDARKRTCEKNQATYLAQYVQPMDQAKTSPSRPKVDWHLSGHSHRSGVYKLGWDSRDIYASDGWRVEVREAKDPGIHNTQTVKPNTVTALIVSSCGGPIGYQNLDGELSAWTGRPPAGTALDPTTGEIRQVKTDWCHTDDEVQRKGFNEKPRLAVALDYLHAMSGLPKKGNIRVPLRFKPGYFGKSGQLELVLSEQGAMPDAAFAPFAEAGAAVDRYLLLGGDVDRVFGAHDVDVFQGSGLDGVALGFDADVALRGKGLDAALEREDAHAFRHAGEDALGGTQGGVAGTGELDVRASVRMQVRSGGGGDACRTGEREMRCGQFGKAAFGRWAAVASQVFVLLLDGMGDGGLVVVAVLGLGCAGRFGQAFDLVACARQALNGFAHVLGVASCIGAALSGDEHAVLGSQYTMGISAQLEALAPGVLSARVVLDARDRPQAQAAGLVIALELRLDFFGR
ncbi:hypothetical protein J2W27_003909, partial [Variovorax boronicumulans]